MYPMFDGRLEMSKVLSCTGRRHVMLTAAVSRLRLPTLTLAVSRYYAMDLLCTGSLRATSMPAPSRSRIPTSKGLQLIKIKLKKMVKLNFKTELMITSISDGRRLPVTLDVGIQDCGMSGIKWKSDCALGPLLESWYSQSLTTDDVVNDRAGDVQTICHEASSA